MTCDGLGDELMTDYLRRLDMATPPVPSWLALCALVSAHLCSVPFENLDIVEGRHGELTTHDVVRKVVRRRRGGFCYELNEAFGALLVHLGFSVKRIEARVWSEARREFGPPFDHLALVIALPEGEFLTDVGFGDNNRTPLRFPGDALTDLSGDYALAPVSADRWLLTRADRPLYEMTLQAQPLAAFDSMYRYHRTSPNSLFAKGLICTRATERGRITLSGDRLVLVEQGRRQETSADVAADLVKYFGIVKESVSC